MHLITNRFFRYIIILVIFVLGGCHSLCAQRVNDSITVSLLTCSPGDMVYELYGHTAIRVVDHTLCTDAVFNYGVFDYNQDNFVWHFLLGQTDYMVQPLPYDIFKQEYDKRGSSIVSQRLNLTREEANTLFNLLMVNARHENCVYRYNFLTSNCTTRVRDMVEEAIRECNGEVVYKEGEKKSYRECLHEFTNGSPWCEVGNDLLLGAAVDTLLDDRSMQFLPEHLQNYFQTASVYRKSPEGRDLGSLPLVAGEAEVLLPAKDVQHPKSFPFSPLVCSLMFLALMLLVFCIEYFVRHQFWLVDVLLMPGSGVAGLLVLFMFLCSEHPSLNTNWQVWVFNPLPLFCMPWVFYSALKHNHCLYHYFYATAMCLFLIVSPWIPQSFSIMTIPVVVGLASRSVSYIVSYHRKPAQASKPRSRKKKA